MTSYKDIILRHEKEINRLHKEIYDCLKNREKSPSHREMWQRAAANYRNYRSGVNDWLDEVMKNDLCNWSDGRDFVFQYLEIDPIYFRSGYVKEALIRKIKSCKLTKNEAEILRGLILRRIKAGARREFRKFCQMIPLVQNQTFADEIKKLTTAKDRDVSHRATFAMHYLTDI